MKGVESPLTVSLRIRPLNEDEIIHGATPVAHGVEGNIVVLLDPTEDPDDVLRVNRSREKQYVFDSVFDGMSGQEEVFSKTTKSLIDNVIHGFNATVFAYGATGAGKTYTMLGTQFEPGIMPRTLNALFQAMEDTQDSMQYKVNMSYFEIYNEMIRDLLNPSSGYLELREDAKGDITVAGLMEVSTRSTTEIMDLLQQGNAVRTQEPTKANLTSSRSHALLQVVVKQRSRARNIHEHIRIGKLYLIDLAGSERASNTQNRGKRMVEGAHINRSLLALGNCINALSEKGGRYVNYRDSKLTRLLKDSLGGNCKTMMIAHVSPASLSFEESRNTLVYADRAKHIKTKVRKNLIDVQYHVAQYTAIIQELREEIERLQHKLHHKTGDGRVSSIKAIQNEVHRHEHEVELAVVKERLLTAFKDQMELRESWMELNTALIEIEGERSRNLRVVTEWEAERLQSLKRRDSTDGETTDNREKEQEKLRELQGYSEETPEPEEVREARQEMKNLVKEMQRTESIKSTVEKEIGESRQKITSMVEELPRIAGNKEHLEILTLLCKVHEKEIENTELKMQLLLRQHEMENNELAIQTFTHYRNLCDEIIRQQRALIEEHNITCPKELEELYELYLQEREDRHTSRAISLPSLQNLKVSSLTSLGERRQMFGEELDKLTIVEPVRDASVLRKQLLKKSSDAMTNQDHEKEDEQKLFSHSPKSKQMKESQYPSSLLSPPSDLLSPPQVKSKEETLYSISVRSNSTVDSPGDNSNTDKNIKTEANVPSPNVPVLEHKDIVSNTRSIAALAAAKKRHKQLDPVDRLMLFDPKLNTTYVSINSHIDQLDAAPGDNYLSTSRLAYHDKKFSSVANVKSLADDAVSFRSFDKRSMVTDTGLLKSNRNKTKKTKGATRKLYRNERSKNPTVVDNNMSYQQMSPEEFFRKLARGGVRKTDPKASSSIPLSKSVQKKSQLSRQKHTARPVISDIREFDMTPTPPSTVYQLNAKDKSKALTVQKRYRAPDSNTSTPQLNPGQRNSRRPPPTIPASYRRGDISVTGFGLK